jgi:hypothetical protein
MYMWDQNSVIHVNDNTGCRARWAAQTLDFDVKCENNKLPMLCGH